MYKINFNHLYYFLTISKEGSIVKASKKLNMTQPALSHQLKILEQDLGTKLFDRVGKRLVINSDGETVKEYASKIFRHSEEMIHFLKSESNEFVTLIKIGTVPWLSKEKIYDFLKPLIFSQHIKIQVYQKDLDTLLRDVQNNRLDIIICDSPYAGRSKKLQGHKLTSDPVVCVAANKTGLRGKFPKNLDNKKIINFSETCLMADKIDTFIKSNNLHVKVIGEFTDTSLIRTTVEKGGVIGFLPLSTIKESVKNKTLVKLGNLEKINFNLWAITLKDYKTNSILDSLLKEYKRSLK